MQTGQVAGSGLRQVLRRLPRRAWQRAGLKFLKPFLLDFGPYLGRILYLTELRRVVFDHFHLLLLPAHLVASEADGWADPSRLNVD